MPSLSSRRDATTMGAFFGSITYLIRTSTGNSKASLVRTLIERVITSPTDPVNSMRISLVAMSVTS